MSIGGSVLLSAEVGYHNIGDIYHEIKEYDLARENLTMSLKISNEKGIPKMQNVNKAFLAFLDAVEGKSTDAIERMQGCISFAVSNNWVWDEIQLGILLGKAQIAAGNLEQGRTHIEKSLRRSIESGAKKYKEVCKKILEDMDKS